MSRYLDGAWSEIRDLPEHELWSVKYRPKTLDELMGPWGDHKPTFDTSANILLVGPPGIGKTSAARCIAREHLGVLKHHNYLETNVRCARDIDELLDKIDDFSRIESTVKRRFVFIDEVNIASPIGQHLIRITMKDCGNSMCFILAGQYKGLSRNLMFNAKLIFMTLSDKQIIKRLSEICEKEMVQFDKKGLKAVLPIAQGDLRKAINYMQEAALSFGCLTGDKFPQLHSTVLIRMFNHAAEGYYVLATGTLYKLLDAGHEPKEILEHFFPAVTQLSIEQSAKIEFVQRFNAMKQDIPSNKVEVACLLRLVHLFLKLVNPVAAREILD